MNRNCGLPGHSAFPQPSDWIEDRTRLPCTHFESCWIPIHHGHWNSVLKRHHEYFLWIGREDMHIAHLSSTNTHAPLFLQTLVTEHKFRDKIFKNFKIAVIEAGPGFSLVSLFYSPYLISVTCSSIIIFSF